MLTQKVNKKIKVLHLIPTLDVGGAEFLIAQILANFDFDNFEITVGCLKRFGPAGKLLPFEIKKEVVVGNKKLTPFDFVKIYKFIKRQKPDIVHTHLWGADVFGILAAKLAGVKIIISTEHNLNLDEGWFKKIFKIFVFKFVSRIIAVSESVAGYCEEELKVPRDKITIIYNGVDENKFFYQRFYDKFKEPVIIGAAGRLTKQKGFEILINSLPYFKNYNFKVKIAGQGPLESVLKKLIKKLHLSDKVELLGEVKDMSAFYQSLDIFVLPSLWEGFGLVVLEAGLSQLPIIASRVDGVKEIIEHKKNGLLFSKGSYRQLAYYRKFLLDNPQTAYQYGTNLQKRIKDNFLLTRTIAKYKDLYIQEFRKV